MQSAKVHVCCSMSESRVIVGLYFFDDDIIKGQNSHLMLKKIFCSRVEKVRQSKLCNLFNRMEHHLILAEMFVIISTKSFLIGGSEGVVVIRWALCFPDLSPVDFFLWGYVIFASHQFAISTN